MRLRAAGPIAVAFAAAASGVALFHLLSVPLPWLLEPLFGCLLVALLGVQLAGIPALNHGMRTILGVAVGATLTPAVLASLVGMWPTLLLVPVMVVATGLVGVPYFRRLCGYDLSTAYFAAMPGGIQDMILFGEEAGADVRRLGLVHATRLLVIVVTLPILLTTIWSADLSQPPGLPAAQVPVLEMAVMVLCGLVGWRAAKRIGLFGASILGPLLLTAAVTLAGGLHYRPPAEAIWAAQFFIGMGIGCKYAGITAREVRHDLLASLGYCLLLVILTLAVVEMLYLTGLASGMAALLAFAPGGQAELTVLALVVGADVAFVVAHHVLRIFVVILGAPLVMRWLGPPRR